MKRDGICRWSNLITLAVGMAPFTAAVSAQEKNTAKAVAVDVAQAESRPLMRDLLMPATLLADEQVDLYAKVSGYVSTVEVDIGSRVEADALLVQLAIPEMDEELQQAEAMLAAKLARVQAAVARVAQAAGGILAAQAAVGRWEAEFELDRLNFARKQELHAAKAIPEQDLDEARSRLAKSEAQRQMAILDVQAAENNKATRDADVLIAEAEVAISQAELARLRTMMRYGTIRAPFKGVITRRMVDHGAFVRSAAEGTTMPMLTIVKDDRIRLALDIPQSDAGFVHTGTTVEVEVRELAMDQIKAAVSRVAGALDPGTRTMRAEVDLDNAGGHLTPGMYARVTVRLQSKKSAMVIPSKALRSEGSALSVFVADGRVARAVPIKIGYDDGVWAEVIGGLDGSEWVITSAGGALTAGMAIEPVK